MTRFDLPEMEDKMDKGPEKRKRGRPKGSSWRNAEDQPVLEEIALLLVSGKAKKVQEAARKAGLSDENDFRRLRRKYKAQKPELEAAVKRALEPEPPRRRPASQGLDLAYLRDMTSNSNAFARQMASMRLTSDSIGGISNSAMMVLQMQKKALSMRAMHEVALGGPVWEAMRAAKKRVKEFEQLRKAVGSSPVRQALEQVDRKLRLLDIVPRPVCKF